MPIGDSEQRRADARQRSQIESMQQRITELERRTRELNDRWRERHNLPKREDSPPAVPKDRFITLTVHESWWGTLEDILKHEKYERLQEIGSVAEVTDEVRLIDDLLQQIEEQKPFDPAAYTGGQDA